MKRCPECDGQLKKPSSMFYIDNQGQRHRVIPDGVWCRSNICGYGGLEEDPDTEHPLLHLVRIYRSDDSDFAHYCNSLAVTGTEINPNLCSGIRKFSDSRLTLQTVVMYIMAPAGYSDEFLLNKFPRLDQSILSEIRSIVAKFPPPPHGDVELGIEGPEMITVNILAS